MIQVLKTLTLLFGFALPIAFGLWHVASCAFGGLRRGERRGPGGDRNL